MPTPHINRIQAACAEGKMGEIDNIGEHPSKLTLRPQTGLLAPMLLPSRIRTLGVRVAAATAFRLRFMRQKQRKKGGGCCHTHSKGPSHEPHENAG